MIDKSNLHYLFSELDQFLFDNNESRSLTIYGGAALIALDILNRATFDINVFQPQLDKILLEAISAVGEKHNFNEYWVNSAGKAFVSELPEGWRSRRASIYSGKALNIFSLGRSDLIFTKILAELDRQENMPDIIRLKPSLNELNSLKRHLS